MNNNQNKFMFFENFLNAIEQLPEEERATACYEFCKYGITGILPKSKYLSMFCLGVSASVQKYAGRGGKRIGAGRPKKQENQYDKENQKIQKNQKNQKIHNIQTETETEKRNIKKKPTREEVIEYAKQRNRLDLAEKFYDYFSSTDWVDSKGNKVKNWKGKFLTWESHTDKPVEVAKTWWRE